jgi:hypothetical protein
MSHDLSWNKHVGYITKKGFKLLYILRQLKIAGISDKDLLLIYISLIRSVLEYAAPVWTNLPQYLSDDIESVQQRALKTRSYYRKENAADMYMQDVLQPQSVFYRKTCNLNIKHLAQSQRSAKCSNSTFLAWEVLYEYLQCL